MIDTDNPRAQKLEKVIVQFAEAMRKKMHKKKIEGKAGWDDRNFIEQNWETDFNYYVTKARARNYGPKDMVDIACYAMMKWNDRVGRGT